MPWPLLDILLALPAFAVVLFRVSGLMLTAPLYHSMLMPTRIRVGFTVAVAALIFPLIKAHVPANASLSTALVGGAGEMMIGAIIGLALSILLTGAEVAGLLIGRQAGIALADVYDPMFGEQESVVGQIYAVCFTLLFLIIGGHRATIAALLDTYTVIPPLSFQFEEQFVVLLVETLAAAFVLGIRLAGPVLITLFLTGIALELLSRTMPQLNILTVGFTFRLLATLAAGGLALCACDGLLLDAVWACVDLVRATFGLDPNHVHLGS